MNLLIKNVDAVTADKSRMFIKNSQIGICGDIINFFSDDGNIPSGFVADKVIDGRHKLALPGLVNAHTHCAMTLLRNYADDLPLEEWLFKKIFPAEKNITAEHVYWGTMLGIAEMIQSGTTAFADMYLHMDEVARAVTETGVRANLSRSPYIFDICGAVSTDESSLCYDYYRRWNGSADGRIKVYVEVHSAYLFNEETLKCASELAENCSTGIQIHILETVREREDSIKKYGRDAAEVCNDCGIFDVPVVAAHCVHLSGYDFDILKSKNVNVAHNPTSNLKLGSGIANVPEMLDKGINVALGTDGTASNNNLNMFEEMHLAAILHKGTNMNPQLVSAEEALLMATANGAKAIGFGAETGVLAKGMKADIILIDTDKPHFYPLNDPMAAAVYSAQGADVDTVIVNGQVLMENRILTTIDLELVKYKVKEIAAKL